MNQLVTKLQDKKQTISIMESCTGGYFVNEITNIEGASDILKFSAVTYSNDYKIKMGVSKDLIEAYSVYSIEVAKDMSKKISDFTDSDYGVGITGKLNTIDKNNLTSRNDLVFVSIYEKENDKYYTLTIEVLNQTRIQNKKLVCDSILKFLNSIV